VEAPPLSNEADALRWGSGRPDGAPLPRLATAPEHARLNHEPMGEFDRAEPSDRRSIANDCVAESLTPRERHTGTTHLPGLKENGEGWQFSSRESHDRLSSQAHVVNTTPIGVDIASCDDSVFPQETDIRAEGHGCTGSQVAGSLRDSEADWESAGNARTIAVRCSFTALAAIHSGLWVA